MQWCRDSRHLEYRLTFDHAADRLHFRTLRRQHGCTHLVHNGFTASDEEAPGSLWIGEQLLLPAGHCRRQAHLITIAGPVARRRTGGQSLLCQRGGCGNQRQRSEAQLCAKAAGTTHFKQVTGKTETGDISHRMHAVHFGQSHTNTVERGRPPQHFGIAGSRQLSFLQRGRENADTQRLRQQQHISSLGAGIAAHSGRIDHPQANQTVDRLQHINRMTAGNRNSSLRTYLGTSAQHLADDLDRQAFKRHSDHGKSKDRLRPHGIDVGQGIGCGNAAKIMWIVDDGSEKISRRHNRLLFVELIHRCIIRRISTHEQGCRHHSGWYFSKQPGQHGRRDFAATASAMGEFSQFDRIHHKECGKAAGPAMSMKKSVATVAQLTEFDEIIDARTPAEFAHDHIPGAVNLPVLDDQQRIAVGTLYKHSAFEARRLGGAFVAHNIAHHLQHYLADKPRNWRPLVYCWRGGQRSGAFTTWLRLVGWEAHQLSGGYKQFRHHVIDETERLAPALSWRVLCGPTGSAKTRVLEALASAGAQTLDLEDLAAHKGSVLGALPDRSQPSQKSFETQLYSKLRAFDPQQPVFVEAESRKIGALFVPEALIFAMRAAPCIVIEASRSARLDYLLRDYAYLGAEESALADRLDGLARLRGGHTIRAWQQLAAQGKLTELFGELIDLHYDPLYRRSQHGNFIRFEESPRIRARSLDEAGIRQLADEALELSRQLVVDSHHS